MMTAETQQERRESQEHSPADDPGGTSRRRCIVKREAKDKEALLRFVIGPDRRIVPDIQERLPGRGIWLSADRETLKKACAKNMFARAARTEVMVPGDLVMQVEQLLAGHCLNLIGLARRAGQAVFGHDKAKDRFRSGRTGLMLIAADASVNAQAKGRALTDDSPLVVPLTASELGAVAGRDRAVFIAVAPGALAGRIRSAVIRLSNFRSPSAASTAPKQAAVQQASIDDGVSSKTKVQ